MKKRNGRFNPKRKLEDGLAEGYPVEAQTMKFDMEWLANSKEQQASEELFTRCRLSLSFRSYQLFRHESLLDEVGAWGAGGERGP